MIVCPPDKWDEWQRLKSQVVAKGDDRDKELQELQAFEANLPRCIVSVSTSKKRTVRVLPRGNWMDEGGDVVQPALPAYLVKPESVDDSKPRELSRLDLARWLVSRDNPLTARTVMNRLWKQFFGMGLSRVLEDLGAQRRATDQRTAARLPGLRVYGTAAGI